MPECKVCNIQMTWAAQRVQYGRIIKKGYSATVAKILQPRCQKCVTRLLKNIQADKEVNNDTDTETNYDIANKSMYF